MRLLLAVTLFACACASTDKPIESGGDGSPDGKTPTTERANPSDVPISYHGGNLLTWDVAVYVIYYGGWLDQNGSWTASGGDAWLIEHFIEQLSGSSWFSINRWYDDRNGTPATNAVHLAGRAFDAYSRGTNLGDDDVRVIVENAIAYGRLPNDPWGIYVVLPTADVAEGGFCSTDCGWHTYTQWGSEYLTYAFIGNGARCPSTCPTYSPSANGVPAGDEMVNVLGHELSESVTDPYFDGWYGGSEENADRCAWNFGATFWLTNGAAANVQIGDRYYLVQQNWAPANPGYCTQGAW